MSSHNSRKPVSRAAALAILWLALAMIMLSAPAWASVLSPALGDTPAARIDNGWPKSLSAADLPASAHSHGDTGEVYTAPTGALDVSGPQQIVVLRTRFSDYTAATRYTQPQVQGFFDSEINTMWGRISYGHISINSTVSALLSYPHPRSTYITDYSDGDLSDGPQFMNVLNDAVALAHTAGIDFTGVKDVMVVMGETSASQYHRGQATTCMLPVGPGDSLISVGCAIFSENPADPDERVWGRWMHEMGHAFQAADGPAHPSNYNNSFELMDRLYPGHSGMFSKQAAGAGGFPGWTPGSSYEVVGLGSAGATVPLYAEEYQDAEIAPGGKRAIKLDASASVYYMISVRSAINGDEIRPIPDTDGVLIERVVPGAAQWVTVKGPGPSGGDPTKLWKADQQYVGDGVTIVIGKRLDPNQAAFEVTVRRQGVPQPDVMIRRWLAPPLNTWETTDIWVDSVCNGYGSFMYGTYTPSGDGSPLGYGNGDSPCANHENRLYARVRNIGTTPASNVVVHFDVSNPLGVGLNGSTWALVGTADSVGFAGLASIAPGAFVDVWVPWTPAVTLTPEQLAAGQFNFHSCVRVRIDPVAGETLLSNQDGLDEQENFGQFFAPPAGPGIESAAIVYLLPMRNDDPGAKKTFNLDWAEDMPAGWTVKVNGDDPTVTIGAGEFVLLPVSIIPTGPIVAGQVYSLTVRATYLNRLLSDIKGTDPKTGLEDIHIEYKPLSAATLAVIVADPTKINIRPRRDPNGGVCVPGVIAPLPPMPPTGGGQGTQLMVDILGAKHELLGSKAARPNQAGQFEVCWTSKEIQGLSTATFASAIYQGQADLPSITSPRRAADPNQPAAPGTFLQPAYAEQLIAVSWNYLPVMVR